MFINVLTEMRLVQKRAVAITNFKYIAREPTLSVFLNDNLKLTARSDGEKRKKKKQ